MQQSTATEGIPSPPQHNREKLEIAKRRVAALKGFYIHLIVFVAVNLGLTALNIATGMTGGSNGYCWGGALASWRTRSQCLAAAPRSLRIGRTAKFGSFWMRNRRAR